MVYHWTVLTHPADLKLKIVAQTKAELFEGALEAMAHVLTKEPFPSSFSLQQELNLSSVNLATLLVDFLNEVLAQSEIEQAVFPRLQIKHLTDTQLQAQIFGFKIEQFQTQIKAVTYHQVNITQNSQGKLEIIILFDL